MITVQEIFAMRKNGQFEEAYAAVLPLYREHHGHYTTLCMFWTATDVMRLRTEAGRCAEAEHILSSLLHLYPNLDDKDNTAAHTLNRLALQLATKEQELRKLMQYRSFPANAADANVNADASSDANAAAVSSADADHSAASEDAADAALSLDTPAFDEEPYSFSLLDYMSRFGTRYLSAADWQAGEYGGHPVASFAAKIISRIFHEVNMESDCPLERLQEALTMVELGLQHAPHSKYLLRYQANLTYRCGNKEQAIALYRQLLTIAKDAYLYSELASIVDDPNEQASLLAQAIGYQRSETFAQKDRLALACLIKDSFPQHAAYELQTVMLLREALGQYPNRTMIALQKALMDVSPVSCSDQKIFYQQLIAKFRPCA